MDPLLKYFNIINYSLLECCKYKIHEKALKLIESGIYDPYETDIEGYTPLIYLCKNEMDNTALKLIKDLDCSHSNIYGDTALLWACTHKMDKVALKIIETGKSNLSQINNFGETALTIACYNKMTEVAIKIIETNKLI